MSVSRASTSVAVLAFTGLAVLGLQAPASAASPGPARCDKHHHHYKPGAACKKNGLILGQRNVHPGDDVSVTIYIFRAGTPVTLLLDGKVVKQLTVGHDGVARTKLHIPGNFKPGSTHRVTARGTAQNTQRTAVSSTVHVVRKTATTKNISAAKASAEATTAATQDDTLALGVLGGAGLLLLGSGPASIVIARRRRPQA